MRISRFLMKPAIPRRFSIMWPNRPAIRKKLAMRNRWMTKKRPLAQTEVWSSPTIHIWLGKKDRAPCSTTPSSRAAPRSPSSP
ncbi:hypothetical protein D3C72_1386020 [compost metagenome]